MLRERILGRSGFRIGDAVLGAMTFGTTGPLKGADEDTCREMYSTFREAGGNCVDTANMYTDGESEEIVGRLIASERDSVVLSTKFTLMTSGDPNTGGSHRKSLRQSVETSLRRLGTDHVDLLFVHAWDQRTPIDETLRALDDLVAAGKVLGIGVSNMPAWVIARSDLLAELRGWERFCAVQLPYSLLNREVDRELLPMARALGLAVWAWSPLQRGRLSGKARPADAPPLPASEQLVVDELRKVAADLGTSPAQVALAWVWHHGMTPVFGGRTVDQTKDNLAAAELRLGDDELARLDAVSAVPRGYPHDFVSGLFPFLVDD
jgi:aryl-alcohol dehydrogenase-like predicted oxidoreductase